MNGGHLIHITSIHILIRPSTFPHLDILEAGQSFACAVGCDRPVLITLACVVPVAADVVAALGVASLTHITLWISLLVL